MKMFGGYGTSLGLVDVREEKYTGEQRICRCKQEGIIDIQKTGNLETGKINMPCKSTGRQTPLS